jgi:manganese efflux pump family protein
VPNKTSAPFRLATSLIQGRLLEFQDEVHSKSHLVAFGVLIEWLEPAGQRPLRPALLFVVFETTMPLIGIVIGRVVGLWFETPAAYLGGLILLAVGLHSVREARHRENEEQRFALDSLRGIILAGLGISMDEIAIGFPLGALRLPIVAVLGAIAIQTFLVTMGGILIGRKINQRLGKQTSRFAGIAAGAAFGLLGSYLILERIFSQSNLP